MRGIAIIVAVGFVGALSGCSGGTAAKKLDIRAAAVSEFAGGLTANGQVELEKRRAKITQDAIAECMTAKGFDYQPFYDAYLTNSSGQGAGVDFTSLDYAKSHGFGVVDNSVAQHFDIPTDPNDKRLLQAPAAEQIAYSAALDGPTSDGSLTCRDQGEKAFQKEAGVDYDHLGDLYTSVQDDPQVVSAEQAWSQCAKTAGFSATSRHALIDEFSARLKQIIGSGPTNNVAAGTLDALRSDEIAAAVATFPCSQAYDKVFLRVFSSSVGQ
ncbi:MAG: hypothetical protein JWM34_1071 [Ilumatobacteraceae bacterium]|nr:hypothetical protein [Ilumatobacteraceae bacterium]